MQPENDIIVACRQCGKKMPSMQLMEHMIKAHVQKGQKLDMVGKIKETPYEKKKKKAIAKKKAKQKAILKAQKKKQSEWVPMVDGYSWDRDNLCGTPGSGKRS